MQTTEYLSVLFRWIHIVAGIIWIGLLYWFNFVNIPFAGLMDGDTKKKVVPELMPRSLFWFRWGAMWTWVTGVLLLLLVFYHGGLMFEEGKGGWGMPTFVILALVFLMFFIYDQLAKSIGKDIRVMGAVGFVLLVAFTYAMMSWAEFSYRAYVIHIGATFGTLMMMNVWMRIWPSQKKIIAAIKEGQAPDAGIVALAGQRSRHNTYMSVPLVWTMINQHTVVPAANSPMYLFAVTLLAWLVVSWLYDKSAKVKGM
ncbi:MAG TPA: urate hydroxylase PuuD [Bacteroidota bacterium]|nr:urate hydroxylase PuuD [Bacteroidota bacterium]